MLAIVWTVAIALIVACRSWSRRPGAGAPLGAGGRGRRLVGLGRTVFAYKLQSLTLGAAIAAVAGVFFTFRSRSSPQDFDPLSTFVGFIIVILAGTAGTAP